MKLLFRIYDTSRHVYLTDDECRIAPSGQVWINMATAPLEDWQRVAETVEDIVLEKAVILYDGRSHEHDV